MMDLETLAARLREADTEGKEADWPEEALAVLREAGCWGNVIPRAYGGRESDRRDILATYEAVARGSLTLALVLTQHDGACDLLARCENTALAQRLLPRFATGELLTTVGISQLTTSRRGKGPAMRAVADGDGFQLDGFMPWVTSAEKADHIVTGAVLDDDRQILACVPTGTPGLAVQPRMKLMALTSSWTSEVRCEGVAVAPEELMRGPVEKALQLRAPVKPLTVSSVGMGTAAALMDGIRENIDRLPDGRGLFDDTIVAHYEATRKRLFDAADALDDPDAEIPSMEIRVAINDLVTRLAVTLMTLGKGSAYLTSHPIQRLVREAMFFLVWSAPPGVQVGTLQRTWAGLQKD